MININSPPGILPEMDGLYRSEISDAFKNHGRLKDQASQAKRTLMRLLRQERESKGLEGASIGSEDLVNIIDYLLTNKSSVTESFAQHEVNNTKCAEWASRTITYSINKPVLSGALDALAKNTDILLIQKYKLLDLKDILSCSSYSAALTKLKKLLVIANRFQDKDNELINKDSIIAAKEAKIEELKQELVRNKSKDWEPQALKLRQDGLSVTKIAVLVNKGRTIVSNYLNSPSIKSQIPK